MDHDERPTNTEHYADLLETSTSLWDTYSVLCAIPDSQLETLATVLQYRAPDTGRAVLARMADDELRLAGYLWAETNTPSHPLSALIADAAGVVRDPAHRRVLSRLLAELAATASVLPPAAAIRALFLFAAVADAIRDLRAIEDGIALANAAMIDDNDRPEYLDLTASLYELRYSVKGRLGDLDTAIDYVQQALTRTPPDNPHRLGRLNNLANWLGVRFKVGGLPADLDTAIGCGDEALTLTARDLLDRPTLLLNQAVRLGFRYEARGVRADLDTAIRYGDEALSGTAPDNPNRPRYLDSQAIQLGFRYRTDGRRADLDTAIRYGDEALTLTPLDSPDRPDQLNNQANLLQSRYRSDRVRADLDTAIRYGDEALTRIAPDNPHRPAHLNSQAGRLELRYDADGRRADLNTAIAYGDEALTLTTPDSYDRPRRLNNQANLLQSRYRADRVRADLDTAIDYGHEAVRRTAPHSPDLPGFLSNLANLQLLRYKATGVRADLDLAIDYGSRVLEATGSANPFRLGWIGNQTFRLVARFAVSRRTADLEALVGLAGLWVELAGSGAAEAILPQARTLMLRLADVATTGACGWGLVRDCARVVLDRAAQLASLPEHVTDELERDAQAISVRARVEGIAALGALAYVRTGDLVGAVDLLESAAATIARDQASRIPWDHAQAVVPELAERALDRQRRIHHATTTGVDTKHLDRLYDEYANAITALRYALAIPTLYAATHDQLADAGLSYVWVVATPHGGLAIRFGDEQIDVLELPNLTSEQVGVWHQHLHPTTKDDDRNRDGRSAVRTDDVPELVGVRGPRGQICPSVEAVERVLDELDEMLAPLVDWLEATDWIIPTGPARLLPWQARHPNRQLHLTATHTLTIKPEQSRAGLFVVFADPEHNLPGAHQEGVALQNLTDRVYFWDDATFATLTQLPPQTVRTLHIAAHGTDEPAIRFHDQPLTQRNLRQIRHLWPHLDRLILNCCMSATPIHGLNDETLTIASVAHTSGTRTTTTALWALPDHHASTWAIHHHAGQPAPNHTPTTAAYTTYGPHP